MKTTKEIEDYAKWILDHINESRKNHKKFNMKKLKFFGDQIKVLAEQNINFERGKHIGRFGY